MATQSFELVMTSGPTPEKKFTLSKQEVIIGRDANADIVINIGNYNRVIWVTVFQAPHNGVSLEILQDPSIFRV